MSLKICPTCGKKYSLDTTMCNCCQISLVLKPESGEKQCPHCHKCLPSLLLYCPYCNRLTGPAPACGTGIPNNKAYASLVFLIFRDLFSLILSWFVINSVNTKNLTTLKISIAVISSCVAVFSVLGIIFSILGLKKSKETGTGKVLSIICIAVSLHSVALAFLSMV